MCAGIEHDYKLLNIPGFTNMSMNILSSLFYTVHLASCSGATCPFHLTELGIIQVYSHSEKYERYWSSEFFLKKGQNGHQI